MQAKPLSHPYPASQTPSWVSNHSIPTMSTHANRGALLRDERVVILVDAFQSSGRIGFRAALRRRWRAWRRSRGTIGGGSSRQLR